MTKKTTKNGFKINKELTYDNFFKHNMKDSISRYKHTVLKSVCKNNNLKITGNKSVLSDRIVYHFEKLKNIIKIQSMIRMYQGKLYTNFRGPAINDRLLCNNQTDFVTLEPITDISFNSFFSYKDENNFVYGFDISSLISHYKINKKMYNPYNRKHFSDKMKKLIICMYNNNFFIDSDFKENNKFFYLNRDRRGRMQIFQNMLRTTQISNVENYNPNINLRRMNIYAHMTTEMQERYEFINQLRNSLNLTQRIDRVFVEIDNLGNYTNSHWFDLTHMQYIRLYRALWDIWTFRGRISPQLKVLISPYHDPFDGIFPTYRYTQNITQTNIKTACLIVFENIIYSGIDEEHRKIGALHALSALTLASQNARFAMPWLYESLV